MTSYKPNDIFCVYCVNYATLKNNKLFCDCSNIKATPEVLLNVKKYPKAWYIKINRD